MKKIIIFDVDRTLVDTYHAIISSFQDAIEEILNIKLTDEEINRLTTLPTKVFLASLNVNDEQLSLIDKEWDKTYRKYETPLFKGIEEVIRLLNNKGYKLGIITSRTKNEFMELKTFFKNVINFFSVIVTSDLVKLPKPNIDSMNYLCNKMNCNSSDIIYIGDSKIDYDFAINSSCIFIPACWDNKELIDVDNACFHPLDIINIIDGYNE